MMLQIFLIFLFFSTSLFSQSKLTIPRSKDLGIVPIGTVKFDYFEIKNETQDTFFIENVYKYDTNPYIIAYNGNYIWSYDIWSSSEVAPRIIFPGEKRAFTYECNSKYEDSISLSGGRLKTKFEVQYVKYNTDIILKDTFSIYNTCKSVKNSVFLNSSGFDLDSYYTFNNLSDFTYQYNLYLKNSFNSDIILDSVRFYNGDSKLNFYGVVNNTHNTAYPKVLYDSLPYYIKSEQSIKIGWYRIADSFYEKKAYIKIYFTTTENKNFVIFDSIYVANKPMSFGFIRNDNYYIKCVVNSLNNFKNKLVLSGISNNKYILDSLSFTDWEKDELQIYSDLGIPLTLESGFYYYLSFNYTPKKTGKTRGKIKAHFRDETGNTFYRYCYLYTEVEDINDVELSKENPLAFYPNPVNSLATLLLDEEPSIGEQVGIYNSLGTLVKTLGVSGKFTQVNAEGFAEGIYIARLLWSGKSVKFCVVR